MPFAPEYIRCVLRENFDDAKALFLEPLLAIPLLEADRAWLDESRAGLASAAAELTRRSEAL